MVIGCIITRFIIKVKYMNKYGISEAKSSVGFKTYAVQNGASRNGKSLRGWLIRGAVFVSAFSMIVSVFAPTTTTFADHGGPYGNDVMNKIVLCHWDASGEDGAYKSSGDVAVEAAINGHDGHSLDIIPPFHYKDGRLTKSYPGKNWNAELWDEGNCGEEKVVVCHQNDSGAFEEKEFKTLEKAEKHIAEHEGDYLLGDRDQCGTVLGCDDIPDNDVPPCDPPCDDNPQTENIPECPDPCDELNIQSHEDDCDDPEDPLKVQILKVWLDENGEEVDPPSNKDGLVIEANNRTGIPGPELDEIVCAYEEDELECDDDLYIVNAGYEIDVYESGLPAGWEVDPSTVGEELVPDCDLEEDLNVTEETEDDYDCTHTVINQRTSPEPCGEELVLNGDFELPEVDNGAGWDIFASGTADLGWSAEWVNSTPSEDPAKVELHEGVLGDDHTSGPGNNQYTELDSDFGGPSSGQSGENASVKIYQDISTVVGGEYTVTFWTSPRPDRPASDNQIRIQVGSVDEVVNNVVGGISWTEHTYTFTATSATTRLSFSDAGPGNSFGGFLDDVSMVQDCLSDVTICKYDDNQNPLAGWEVFLKGEVADTVEVESEANGTNFSSIELPAGDYILEAEGTYVYRPGSSGDISDAGYTLREPNEFGGPAVPYWLDVNSLPNPWEGYLGIQVDESSFNWGPLDETNHEYSGFYNLGTDGEIKFRILDSYYGDNDGSLEVKIYPIYMGTTGENGCATLEDVPFGHYNVDEIMQEGWINLHGRGQEAHIDGIEDTFNLINECDTGCESMVKVCKEDPQGNGLPDWTVYLKGDEVEDLEVPSAVMAGVNTSTTLESGKKYLVEVSGEWQNRGFETVDTSYTTPDGWSTVLDAPQGGFPDDLLELQINSSFIDWGSYSSSHEYSYIVDGNGAIANFRVFDGDVDSNTPNSGWYGDNIDGEDGGLFVTIYEVYSGVTGDDGCVTIEGVPFGTYDLGEVMKDGWSNVEGVGDTVVVDEPTEGFDVEEEIILVNECDSRQCEPSVPRLHLIKVVCDEFSDIAGNESADENNEVVDDKYIEFSNYDFDEDGISPHFPVFTGFVDPSEIPDGESGCVLQQDWQFLLTSDQGQNDVDEGSIKTTGEFGEYVTPISGEGSDLSEELQAGIRNGNFWVSEIEQEGYDFAQIRCYNDALYGDNLEFINLGEENPAHVYCIAYNVEQIEQCVEETIPVALISDENTQTAGYATSNPVATPLSAGSYNDGSFANSSAANTVIPPWFDPVNLAPFSGSGAKWISTTSAHPGQGGGEGLPTEDQWRLFQKSFTVPSGVDISEGTLYFTADNSVSVYHNGVFLDDTSENLGTFDTPHPQGPYQVFSQVYSVNFTPVEGNNTLEFVVRNSGGSYNENPTALLYKADFSYTTDCDDDEDGQNIGGNVYSDANNDYDRDEGEAGLAGWTVNLYELVEYEEEGEGFLPTASDTTDENGDYIFTDLDPGCYIVEEELEPGWNQRQPGESDSADYKYYVTVGDVECYFNEEVEAYSLLDLFIKTANAATDNYVDVPTGDYFDLDFGNFSQNGGGGSSSTSSGSRSSGSDDDDDDGRVLGDSIGLPYQNPQVLGAELPRTGTPIALAFTFVGILAIILVPRVAKMKIVNQ